MGDRCLIVLRSTTKDDKGKTQKHYSPVIYSHWSGSRMRGYLTELRDLMESRGGDLDYAAARMVGILHSKDPEGNLSLGMWNLPDDFRETKKYLEEYSHGDAGVVIVNVKDKYSWKAYGGYLNTSKGKKHEYED